MALFDVAEESDASQCPMPGIRVRLEIDGSHIFLIGSLWFSIYGTFVNSALLACCAADGVDVYDRHRFVEDLKLFLEFVAV